MILPLSFLATRPQTLPRNEEDPTSLYYLIPIEVNIEIEGVQSYSQVAGPCLDILQLGSGMPISHKVPGTRCPTCALEGKEVWVIPGRYCGYCGTPCDH